MANRMQYATQDAQGNLTAGVAVEVRDPDSNALIDLFSDEALTTAVSNPGVSDSSGFFDVWCSSAQTRVTVIAGAGASERTLENVFIGPEPRYDSFADFIAATDTFAAGTLVEVPSIGAVYEAVASGGHVTNAGGQEFTVQKVNGSYADNHFSSLSDTFAAAAGESVPLRLTQRSYTVTENLLSITSGSADLWIFLDGDTEINVSGGAYLGDLVLFQTDTPNNFGVFGGTLTINGNNLIRTGFYVRHLSTTKGGSFVWDNIRVTGLTNSASDAGVVSGVAIIGRYEHGRIGGYYCADVTRVTTGGECSGLTISGFGGECWIYGPHVKNIQTGPSGVDADGIKTFGHILTIDGEVREGRFHILNPIYEDCQGRSHKDQAEFTTISNPTIIRDASVLVGATNGVDIAFQNGAGKVTGAAKVIYRADGATSPLGSSHTIINFVQRLTNAPMVGSVEGLVIETDVEIPRGILVTYAAGAERGDLRVSETKIIARNGFSAKVFRDAFIEQQLGPLVATPAKTTPARIEVCGLCGPVGTMVIGYRGYDGVTDVSDRVEYAVRDCINTETTTMRRPVRQLADSAINEFAFLLLQNNTGYRDLYAGARVLDWSQLPIGHRENVDIAQAVVVTDGGKTAPPWPASGYADIIVHGQWFSASDRTIEVMLRPGTKRWITYDSGVNWQEWVAVEQQPALNASVPSDVTVTATTGTLPTPDGSVTVADAAAPTNDELLELVMELRANQNALADVVDEIITDLTEANIHGT